MAEGTLPVNEAQYYSLPQYYTDTAQNFSGFVSDYLSKLQGPGGYASGYTGQRVAGQDPYQQAAYNQLPGVIGSQTPYVNAGANTMLTGQNWLSQAQQYMNQKPNTAFDSGVGMIGGQYNQLGGVDPYLNQGGNLVGTGAGYVGAQYNNLGNVNPYLNQGQGALNQAGGIIQGTANYNPAEHQRHLSPYIGGVANEIARRGNENLTEDILPEVNSTFTGAGQFGSTRNADFNRRAIRDTQREILGAQSNALNQAHGQAANDYLGWAQQGVSAGGALGQVGQGLGNLGNIELDKIKTGANMGALSGQLGGQYSDFAKTYLDKLTTGANMGTSTSNVGGQQASYGNILGNMGATLSNLGDAYGTYGSSATDNRLAQLKEMFGFGATQQQYNQGILDNAYTDWQSRWTNPADLAGALSTMIPNYAGKVSPDIAKYSAPAPTSQNDYSDLLAILSAL